MGIGDWGLGIRDWGLGASRNTQSITELFITGKLSYIFFNKLLKIKKINKMGCTCENNKEEENIEIKKPANEMQIYKLDPILLNNIITLQSHVRGVISRKKFNEFKQQENQISRTYFSNNNENKNSIFEEEEITESDINYLFSNYPPLNDGIETEIKPTVYIDNGDLYYGEWDISGNKHGRGIQLWADRSKYIGYWINNKANKKGKLIHKDGDRYDGEWLDDKA